MIRHNGSEHADWDLSTLLVPLSIPTKRQVLFLRAYPPICSLPWAQPCLGFFLVGDIQELVFTLILLFYIITDYRILLSNSHFVRSLLVLVIWNLFEESLWLQVLRCQGGLERTLLLRLFELCHLTMVLVDTRAPEARVTSVELEILVVLLTGTLMPNRIRIRL